jgi:hypothetical protein
VRPAPGTVDPQGTPLALASGGSHPVDLPFRFPFYGRTYDSMFVNADGNVTFDAPDTGPGERGLARLLGGPPRIAGFLAGLDPTRSGSVSLRLGPDRASVLWAAVPGATAVNRNTFEIGLLADGAVEVAFGTEVQTREVVVGLSPGGNAPLTVADLSRGEPRGAAGALVERFGETEKLDLVSVVRRFLAGHDDVFEQIVVYTTRPLNPAPGTLAFEVNTRNTVRGIGLDPALDEAAAWGSAGALASVVYMDGIDAYLDVDGFEILAHEVGHRWLARLSFRDHRGRRSDALLGRGLVHWSFFLESGASLLEGNQIEDRGGGRFETVDLAARFSPLDQYAMGLRAASEVPPFFYVEEADDFRPNRAFKVSSTPEIGVGFTGVRRDVSIEDVVAVMGPRSPAAPEAPRVLRQAYLLVGDGAGPATPERVAAVERIRSRSMALYQAATEGRGRVDPRLR